MKFKKLLFILTCIFSVANFYATDYYVKATGSDTNDGLTEGNAFLTVDKAVTTATNPADKIIIVGTVDFTTQISFNKTLTFEGQSNAVLNSNGTRFFTIPSGSANTISFSNITFQNAATNLQGAVLNNSTQAGMVFNFTNCNFINNTTSADNGGGVFYFSQDAVVNISGCTFYNNAVVTSTAANARGGAINIFSTASVTISNSTFYGNKVARNVNNGDAAAIRVNTGTNVVNISNSLFYNNKNNNGSGISTDVAAIGTALVNITNSLAQAVVNVAGPQDDTTGSVFTNSDFLSTSNLTWNGTLNKITFTAPSSKDDTTPIDFGNNNSDVGAWDSKINLFKAGSDWASGTWSSTAVPTALENATILSDSPALTIAGSTNAVCNNLSVNASSSLTINAGGSLIVNGTSTGNVTYNRTLTAVSGNANGWHLIASPVTGQVYNNAYATSSDLATSGTKRGLSWYNTSGNSWFYLENNDSNAGTFTSGLGYSLKRNTTGTVGFTGTINTSDVNGVSVSTSGNGFNLVGNPYTSYMSSETFLDANTNLDTQIWTWTHASGYTARPKATNFTIVPGQGFFVKALSGSTVNFAESNQASGTDNFQKSASTKTEINLTINDTQITRGAQLLYFDNVTTGFDNGYEGELFGGVSHTLAIYSDLVTNSNGKKIQVQSLPKAEMENMIVPLGIIAAQGKELTFTAEALNLPNGLKVFLEDRETNTFTELTSTNNYKVTLNSDLNGIGRFFVHTASSVLSTPSIDLTNVNIYTTGKQQLRITGVNSDATVKVFNILGKQVFENSFSSKGVTDLNLPAVQTGVYIIQLTTTEGKLNKKIVLE